MSEPIIDFLAKAAEKERSTRPEVRLQSGQLPWIVTAVEDALIEHGAPIYCRGGILVRPGRTTNEPDEDDAISRPRGTPGLYPLTVPGLIDTLGRHIDFQKYNERNQAWRPADCPEGVAAALLARTGQYRLPTVTGLIEAPTLRPDDTILDEPGFDPDTGLLYMPSIDFPPVPEAPTKADAERALGRLLEPFAHFPFKEPTDKAVFLALMLTSLVRAVLPSAPLGGLDAPAQGTGKSHLCDAIAILATGRPAPAMGQSASREEERKLLTSILIAGSPLAVIDNVARPLDSAVLCTILTQPTWTDRVLGISASVTCPTNILLLANGNNLRVEGDLTSRTIVSRLDAQMERPDERRFDGDIRATLTERRPEMVRDALTILRAYAVAGHPKQEVTPCRFTAWARTVRDAIVWLEQPDPVASRTKLASDDPTRALLGALLLGWEGYFGDNARVAEAIAVADKVRKAASDLGAQTSNAEKALAEAVDAIVDGRGGSKRLAYFIRSNEGTILDGRRFERGTKSRDTLFSVVRRPPVRPAV